MENKLQPLAWMYYDNWNNLKLAQTMPPDPNMFPVYTEPQYRELSDEEINQIVWQQNLLLRNDDLRKFARAILKKAVEK